MSDLVMGWIRDLIPSGSDGIDNVQIQSQERFPLHTYGPGYPIVVHRQELTALDQLLEIEGRASDGWDNTSLLGREDFEEIIGDMSGETDHGLPTPEEHRNGIREIIELWREQLTNQEDSVWATIGTEYQFEFYIAHCEGRAGSEVDDFEKPDELDTAREILGRIQTARNTDSKTALVHKRHLPLEEPKEDSTGEN